MKVANTAHSKTTSGNSKLNCLLVYFTSYILKISISDRNYKKNM